MLRFLKWSLWIATGLACTFVCLVVIAEVLVEQSANGQLFDKLSDLPTRDVALVLGTSPRTRQGRSNLFFKYRMEAAFELYSRGKVKKILVSGDNGTRRYDETTAMLKALRELGVPNEDIVGDYAGFRTLDSVLRARNVFGLNRFIIVSQPFHLKRALFIAGLNGIDAVGYSAQRVEVRVAYLKVRVRESVARLGAVIDYLIGTKPKFNGPPEPIDFTGSQEVLG